MSHVTELAAQIRTALDELATQQNLIVRVEHILASARANLHAATTTTDRAEIRASIASLAAAITQAQNAAAAIARYQAYSAILRIGLGDGGTSDLQTVPDDIRRPCRRRSSRAVATIDIQGGQVSSSTGGPEPMGLRGRMRRRHRVGAGRAQPVDQRDTP